MRRACCCIPLLLIAGLFAACHLDEQPSITPEVLPEVAFPGESARILLFGDSGTGDRHQYAVALGMASRHAEMPYDFALMLGDNFYESGVFGINDPQFQTKFRIPYPASAFPFKFYVILGNHDHRGNVRAQYEYHKVDSRWTAPGPAYLLPLRFADGRRTDIYCLDSEYLTHPSEGPRLVSWMRDRIRMRGADQNILVTHKPLRSSGSHGDDSHILRLLTPLLVEGLIDISIAGHDHDLELQERDTDGDGTAELFIVSGAAGKIRSISGGYHTRFAYGGYGFAELRMDGSGTETAFYDKNGNVLFQR